MVTPLHLNRNDLSTVSDDVGTEVLVSEQVMLMDPDATPGKLLLVDV